jgi:hypothetical protein
LHLHIFVVIDSRKGKERGIILGDSWKDKRMEKGGRDG